jgi:hypothetical protein
LNSAQPLDNSYEHHNIDEPAVLLGGAFVVDIPGTLSKGQSALPYVEGTH